MKNLGYFVFSVLCLFIVGCSSTETYSDFDNSSPTSGNTGVTTDESTGEVIIEEIK